MQGNQACLHLLLNSQLPVNVSLSGNRGRGLSLSFTHTHKLWERGQVKGRGLGLRNILRTVDKERHDSPTCLVKLQPACLVFADRACRVSSWPKSVHVQHTHTHDERMHTCYTPATAARGNKRKRSEIQMNPLKAVTSFIIRLCLNEPFDLPITHLSLLEVKL